LILNSLGKRLFVCGVIERSPNASPCKYRSINSQDLGMKMDLFEATPVLQRKLNFYLDWIRMKLKLTTTHWQHGKMALTWTNWKYSFFNMEKWHSRGPTENIPFLFFVYEYCK